MANKKITPWYWFMIIAATAIAAFILLINTNSYHADRTHSNGVYLWGGIALAVLAIALLYFKVIKQTGGGSNPDM